MRAFLERKHIWKLNLFEFCHDLTRYLPKVGANTSKVSFTENLKIDALY